MTIVQFRRHRRATLLATVVLGAAFVHLGSGAAEAATYTCDGKPATIVGTDGKDTIEGTPGNDVIVGLAWTDVIHGRGGDDVICAFRDSLGSGDVDPTDDETPEDRLFGDEGNDRLIGSGYSHSLASGGSGDDSFVNIPVDYQDAPGPVSVDLQTGVGTGWGNDTFAQVAVVHGSNYDDTLLGLDQELAGGRCACDSLYGHGGDDVINGRRGWDTLYGGTGADRIWTGPGSGPFTEVAYPGSGRDQVHGDPVTGGKVSYALIRRAVFVDLRGGVARGQGHDRLFDIDEVTGSRLADVIHGDTGRNVLFGFGGRDLIRGHGGADVLYGSGSNDRLYGNAGSDTAYGGPGNDICRAEEEHSC